MKNNNHDKPPTEKTDWLSIGIVGFVAVGLLWMLMELIRWIAMGGYQKLPIIAIVIGIGTIAAVFWALALSRSMNIFRGKGRRNQRATLIGITIAALVIIAGLITGHF